MCMVVIIFSSPFESCKISSINFLVCRKFVYWDVVSWITTYTNTYRIFVFWGVCFDSEVHISGLRNLLSSVHLLWCLKHTVSTCPQFFGVLVGKISYLTASSTY